MTLQKLIISIALTFLLASPVAAKMADIIMVLGVASNCKIGLYQSWGNRKKPDLQSNVSAAMMIMLRYLRVDKLIEGITGAVEDAGGTVRIIKFDLDPDDKCNISGVPV